MVSYYLFVNRSWPSRFEFIITISEVKETISDANLIQDDLVRIKGFMEVKAQKGASFLSKFKNNRALELAQELEDLEGQLNLSTMEV